MPSKNQIELKILRKQCPAPTCSRNQYSWSTPDLHTARPPNKIPPQHRNQSDTRTRHPEIRYSDKVFERLLLWIALVTSDMSRLIWVHNTNSLQYFCKSPHFDNPGWTHTQHPSQGNLLHILRKQILLWGRHILNANWQCWLDNGQGTYLWEQTLKVVNMGKLFQISFIKSASKCAKQRWFCSL